MNLKIRIERPSRNETPRKVVKAPEPRLQASARAPFLSSFEDYVDASKMRSLKNQQVLKINSPKPLPPKADAPKLIPPKSISPATPRPGLLNRLLSLLRGVAPAQKQLKLVETVSLGEKRFVAIVHADGRKFLVGGGTSGVSMLAQLEEQPKASEHFHSLAGPTELAV